MLSQVKKSSVVLLGSSALTLAIVACGDSSSTKYSRLTKVGPNGPVTSVANIENPSEIEKIIGENDLTPLNADGSNVPEKYRSQIDAYGKISMGCTATHIGNGLVISAGHCFDAPSKRANNMPCADITVEWGVRAGREAYLKSKCVKVLAAELNDDRDYAILLVSPAPTATIDVDYSKRVGQSTKITIFGHPQMRPLEWSKVCTVEPSSNGPWGKDQFAHQCDTEPGNSGSTVIDDSSLKVIGIHDGGRAPWNYATYLYDTPIREFVGQNPTPVPTSQPTSQPTVRPTAQPTSQPTVRPTAQPTVRPTAQPTAQPTPPIQFPDQVFGPFGKNEDRVLLKLEKSNGDYVNFVIDADTEPGYDNVTVIDAYGRKSKVTGLTSKVYRSMKAPVTIRFKSDAQVSSKKVAIRDIVFSN